MSLPEIHAFLGCRTPAAWVEVALQHQDILLIDHKNCEFKAASTALSLIAKYNQRLDLVNYMSRLAREGMRESALRNAMLVESIERVEEIKSLQQLSYTALLVAGTYMVLAGRMSMGALIACSKR